MENKRKVYHTALCIVPPKSEWSQIQSIREKNDSAYKRWMPHINLCFPFVDINEFEEAHKWLEKGLSSLEPFEVRFKQMKYFTHSKKCVLYLEPETDSLGELGKEKDSNWNWVHELEERIIQKCVPFCDEQTKKSDNGFTPHLTLGQFSKKEIQKTRDEFMKDFKEISFTCDKICMISRGSKEAPFEIIKTVQLKK